MGEKISIQIEVAPHESFSINSLLHRYSAITPDTQVEDTCFGSSGRLCIRGKWYDACNHWGITKEGVKTIVTLFLRENRFFGAHGTHAR